MSPTSENTSILLIAMHRRRHRAGGALRRLGAAGGADRRACCSSSCNPRPWAWPRQLGTAASLLTMLMFVLVSVVAAQADWNPPVAGVVLALIGRARAGQDRRRARWPTRAAAPAGGRRCWTGCAMSPMSSIALLLVSQFVSASPHAGAAHRQHRPARHPADGGAGRDHRHLRHATARGESSQPWTRPGAAPAGDAAWLSACCRTSRRAATSAAGRAARWSRSTQSERAVAGRRARAAAGQHPRLRPGALRRRHAAPDGARSRCRAAWCRR